MHKIMYTLTRSLSLILCRVYGSNNHTNYHIIQTMPLYMRIHLTRFGKQWNGLLHGIVNCY